MVTPVALIHHILVPMFPAVSVKSPNAAGVGYMRAPSPNKIKGH